MALNLPENAQAETNLPVIEGLQIGSSALPVRGLLLYAVSRKDPLFIVGQAGSLVIYLRYRYHIFKERSQQKAVATKH